MTEQQNFRRDDDMHRDDADANMARRDNDVEGHGRRKGDDNSDDAEGHGRRKGDDNSDDAEGHLHRI